MNTHDALNWYGIAVSALTAIRRDWTIEKLEALAAEGNPTAVSGDMLAPIKNWS